MSAGRFVWRELVVSTPAIAFYAELFGWSAKPAEMGGMTYTMLHNAALGEDVGGSMAPQMSGVPPHWLAYLTVEDIDAALIAVTRLGGRALTPVMQAEGVGRFFVAQDPGGATFAAFVGDQPGATPERRPPLDTFCWSTLMAANPGPSVAFYQALCGWTVQERGPMVVFSTGDVQRASAQAYPPGTTGMPDAWLNYVAVADCDASFAKASALGAGAIKAPMDIPGVGRFAVIADPTGAVLALFTPSDAM